MPDLFLNLLPSKTGKNVLGAETVPSNNGITRHEPAICSPRYLSKEDNALAGTSTVIKLGI